MNKTKNLSQISYRVQQGTAAPKSPWELQMRTDLDGDKWGAVQIGTREQMEATFARIRAARA